MKKSLLDSCPCNSGRKYTRCCALAGLARLQALLQDAMVWQEQGDAARALLCYQRVLKNDKRNAPASYLCGTVFQQRGDFARALSFFEQAFKWGLKDSAAKIQYVHALLSTGQLERAIKVLQKILAVQSEHTQARHLLANLYFETDDFLQAEKHYRQLLKQQNNDWRFHFNLGHTLYHLAQIPAAIEQFKAALVLEDNNAEIYASLSTMYHLDNKLDDARSTAQKTLVLQADNVSATIVMVRLLRRQKHWPKALAMLDHIDPQIQEPGDQVLWWHERGHLLDAMQRYKEAFEAYSRSRQALSDMRGIVYDATLMDRRMSASEACFSSEGSAESGFPGTMHERFPRVCPQPLFIVGFYRSGTTLLEQMLSSHQNICGVGETNALALAEDRLELLLGSPYPACFNKKYSGKAGDELPLLRQEYQQELAKLNGFQNHAHLVIDKFLFNMLRLPLVHLMFPESSVIHMVRHPLDTILSTYTTLFLERNEWSFTLLDIAHTYIRCHQHVQRMKHMLGDRYYCLQYENLIEAPEKELRALLEFSGEVWDQNCLEFCHNPRVARTASYEQVTRELHTNSKFRYKNYLEYIDKQVIQILKPVIVEMGYRFEN